MTDRTSGGSLASIGSREGLGKLMDSANLPIRARLFHIQEFACSTLLFGNVISYEIPLSRIIANHVW